MTKVRDGETEETNNEGKNHVKTELRRKTKKSVHECTLYVRTIGIDKMEEGGESIVEKKQKRE